ncbi:MAG: signal recognition particle receptor subunit alpha [Nanoarchaeota archaeon]|nr:signal recognition particle receptor subunit alpha [Nanoarchaeota archaeon]
MLEKLSSGLKEALRKIAKAGYIDTNTVNELVRDIQRTLIASDVDVKLVFKLTESIKKRSLGEKPGKGMTAREHIVNIVYEELVKFVGEKPELMLKPGKVLFIGLFGSGKCVHPDSLVSLDDGRLISAANLYNEYTNYNKQILEDGEIIDISNKELFVPSFNPYTLKVERKKVTHLWKLEKDELLNVYLDNGNDFSVKVTVEHPFFVMRNGQVIQVRADMLNVDDFVSVPRNYICNTHQVSLFSYLKDLNLDVYISPKEAKENILKIYPNLKIANKNLLYTKNYCKFTMNVKDGKIPIEFIKNEHSCYKLKLYNATKLISFPNYLTSEFAEFLGYVFGDGHLDKGYVEISNENKEVIDRVIELSKSLFNIIPEIKKDGRTKNMYKIRIVSTTLVHIMNKMFGVPIGKKGKKLKISEQIFRSHDRTVISFLRAYFDCDGYSAQGTREIEISSESKNMISGTNLLLKRFGIMSTISKKIINKVPYWRLFIRARYAELYTDKIGFMIMDKMKRASEYKSIGIKQGCGKQDLIPVGSLLEEIRTSLGFSIGELQNVCNSYGQYERNGMISRESLAKVVDLYEKNVNGIHFKFLSIIRNNTILLDKVFSTEAINSLIYYYTQNAFIEEDNGLIVLTKNGLSFLENISNFDSKIAIEHLNNLCNSDVCWSKVDKIENYKNETGFVYDLTVEDNHSFIADGIIVHNTTSIGKLARFYQRKGLKPALIGCDVHRPAAMDQLKQLAEQLGVPYYIDKVNKDAVSIARAGLKALEKNDILIFDSSGRDALDGELAKELKELGEVIKPDEVILAIPADLGQAAGEQASEFNKLVGITGIFLTKMDGTARGGGAITACSITDAPVKFIGVGEKMDALEVFDPERFISRLVGFGDLQALVEKAKESMEPEKAEKIAERMSSGKFTMDDFYEQLKGMGKMGSLKSMMDMIPGMGGMKLPKNLDLNKQEGKMKKWKYVIESMTKAEREDPELIDSSRVSRIAKGSGTDETVVRELLKNFKQSKKMMKMMTGKGMKRGAMSRFAKKFKGMM